MKVGDLIKVVPSDKVHGYTASYVRRHYKQVGIVIDFQILGGITYLLTLIDEQTHLIPEHNAKLINQNQTG